MSSPAAAGPCASGRFADGARLASPGGLELVCHAVDLAGLVPGDRLLDVGCGGGETTRGLRARRELDAVGVDREAAPGCIQADAARLPFEDASVDGVLLECALSVMAEPERVLAECARVLGPGGKLVLLDLYARTPGAAPYVGPRLRGRDELAALLGGRGFSVLACEDHSEALKQLVLTLVMERGSADDLCGTGGLSAFLPLRPGYLLVVAVATGSTSRPAASRGW